MRILNRYLCLVALAGIPLMAQAEMVAVNKASRTASPMAGPGVSVPPGNTSLGNVPNSPATHVTTAEVNGTRPVAIAFARLHHVNMVQIEVGRLASQKGKSQEVRAYGELIMRDHQISDRRLMTYAAENNIPVDRAPAITAEQSVRDAESTTKLVGAAPDDFDRVFLQQMASGHAVTLNELAGALAAIDERGPRNLLAKIKPVIEQHQRLGNILLDKNS